MATTTASDEDSVLVSREGEESLAHISPTDLLHDFFDSKYDHLAFVPRPFWGRQVLRAVPVIILKARAVLSLYRQRVDASQYGHGLYFAPGPICPFRYAPAPVAGQIAQGPRPLHARRVRHRLTNWHRLALASNSGWGN